MILYVEPARGMAGSHTSLSRTRLMCIRLGRTTNGTGPDESNAGPDTPSANGGLAAHAGTIMGVETNSMQFCPEASKPEEAVHPGIYRRRKGLLDLFRLGGFPAPPFGYRHSEIERELPEVAASFWNSQITGL